MLTRARALLLPSPPATPPPPPSRHTPMDLTLLCIHRVDLDVQAFWTLCPLVTQPLRVDLRQSRCKVECRAIRLDRRPVNRPGTSQVNGPRSTIMRGSGKGRCEETRYATVWGHICQIRTTSRPCHRWSVTPLAFHAAVLAASCEYGQSCRSPD